MMTERTIRRRVMLSRSRAGCLTCKTRRVKCDEAKPICQRCAKANRECAGYSSGESKDTNSRPLNITYYTPNLSQGTRISDGKRSGLDGTQDQGALDYFFKWCLKCFPSDLMLHHLYYEKIHEPAIKHAMATLGLLFEIYTHDIKGSARIQRSVTAMQHYDRAIRSLLSQSGKSAWNENLSTLILTCFLFVCIESAQGNYQSALSHLQSGFKVYQEGKKKLRQAASDVGVSKEEIRFHSLFGRLLCQLTHFDAADCARFFGIMDWSKGEKPQQFTDIDSARWALLAIVERLIPIRNMWASRNAYSGLLRDTESIYPSAGMILDHLAQEMLRLDQWILAFNIYLSHGISTSQMCEAYVLALCGFFLKFRITMDQAAINSCDCPHLDFSHIARLGDTLLYECSTSSTEASCDLRTAVYQVRQEAKCPIHALFTGDNCPKPLPNSRGSDEKPSDQHRSFLFLYVFCSLCVASVYSSDLKIRQKARDIVGSVCSCEAGWDMTLTNHIAHLFCPATNTSNYETKRIPPDNDVLYKFEEVTSPELHVLLAQLRYLG